MNFLYNHKDTIEVIGVSAIGLKGALTATDLVLKVVIGLLTIGFIVYKWKVEYNKNKK